MNRDTAYVSSIPAEAREEAATGQADNELRRIDYYLGAELVGSRFFRPDGELEAEYNFRNGIQHGWQYRWHAPGRLLSAEPYENGVPHGTAYQWADDGKLIGSYTMEHGTGIDLWWTDWGDGSYELEEVHYLQDGLRHGFEWWLWKRDRVSELWQERHWFRGVMHGIERDWNGEGRLRRGYPRYWVEGERVTKAQYLRAAAKDDRLPPFRSEDNLPYREFPPEIVAHIPRHGWGAEFQAMAAAGDDCLLDGNALSLTALETEEWEW